MSVEAKVAVNGRVPRALSAVKTPGLMDALLAVQAEAPKLRRDATGQIGSRSYGYVTLDAVVDAVLPLLVAHELCWVCFPTCDERGAPALRYRLTHLPTGESEQDVMALMCASPDPQGQGSALTYAKRYALCAVLNLTTGDDDDGARARTGPPASQPAPQPQSAAAPAAARASNRPASTAQRKMLRARAGELDLTAEEFANVILGAAGEPARHWDTHEGAEQTLERLIDRLPSQLVSAVKDAIALKGQA